MAKLKRLTILQQRILNVIVEKGEIMRRDVGQLQSIHYLTARGILEYVANGTGDHSSDVWKLTPHGRHIVDGAGVGRLSRDG